MTATGTKPFKVQIKTRDGRTKQFKAAHTHDTKAKRRAGLTSAGKPQQTVPKTGRNRWWARPRVVVVGNSLTLVTAGVITVYTKYGPVACVVVLVVASWGVCKVFPVIVRALEMAARARSAVRRIKGRGEDSVPGQLAGVRVPSDRVRLSENDDE
ncbi:hypothetical protein FNQ90_02480 [Streptomyces alkaliphilus]|uniref:Uncharacterized protein n=1 Tax=Streptomyces alkaliphilus TaxID=1472722 RepID=A0A7W3TA85_9ACTN|nr:hypothetical protein [Streptomyces alkaliphilus]MBB0243002.1 hypothetical protein [Streptomyces alkaliphilus]